MKIIIARLRLFIDSLSLFLPLSSSENLYGGQVGKSRVVIRRAVEVMCLSLC